MGLVALTLTFGCTRFGYDASRPPRDPKPPTDSAISDAGGQTDPTAMDASKPSDASGVITPADAKMPDDADVATDSGAGPTDSGAMDSGDMDAADMPDSSVEDSAVDSGAIERCPENSNLLFCDGFEDTNLERWSYDVLENGSVDRTTARYRSGTASLRATTGAAGTPNEARKVVEVFDHQKSGDIWARYYYYLPSSVTINSYFSSVVVEEIEQPFFGFSLLILPNQVAIEADSLRYDGTMAFPRNKWTCVELHVQIDPVAGFFEAYIDGALAARSTATDTLPDKGYTTLEVGVHYTDPSQGPVTAYVDDVVAANTRTGCN